MERSKSILVSGPGQSRMTARMVNVSNIKPRISLARRRVTLPPYAADLSMAFSSTSA